VFFFPDGAFNPVVSDFGAIYLSGYSRLYQMLPKRRRRPPAVARRAPAGRPAV
jgi:hypothetical protein